MDLYRVKTLIYKVGTETRGFNRSL